MASLKKRNIIMLLAGLFVVAIIVSSMVYVQSQRHQESLTNLTIGMEPNQTNLLVYVAENQGYFRDNGLNVTIKNYNSGAAATNAMLNGEVNLASATEFVLQRSILSNTSIQTIGSISKFTHVYLIVNKTSGVQNPLDLIGKKVGLTLQTNSQFYFGRFLQLNNLGLDQVNVINVPTSQYLAVIANGTVDAVVAWQPYPATIQTMLGKDNIITWDVQSSQLGYEPIISTTTWISNNHEMVEEFLASLAQAQHYLINNPSTGQSIAMNQLNFTSNYVQITWPNYDFTLSLDQSLLLAMQDEATWMISNNLTNSTSLPNFLKNVYLDGLQSVDPNSITIIH
jgi:NitT/TauT family transport system substrate-binding protein